MSHGEERMPADRVPQDHVPGVISLDEMDRQTDTIKVYAPDDPDIWVKVQRVLTMRCRGPNGSIWKFNLRPPPPPPRPARTA
jgi:hypothetical protein